MLFDWKDLEYIHNEECNSKDSKYITKTRTSTSWGKEEYNVQCRECGEFLYHFDHGSYER